MKRILIKVVKWLSGIAITLAVLVYFSSERFAQFGSKAIGERYRRMQASSPFDGKIFKNSIPSNIGMQGNTSEEMGKWFFGEELREPTMEIPVVFLDSSSFTSESTDGLRITWMGHSTVLIELEGYRILTDPVWAERASPISFAGPARFHPPPIALSELPQIDIVIVSHDHYDHLDMKTIIALAATGAHFVLPLGVGAHLEGWGIDPQQFSEMDWWESWRSDSGNLEIAATPARHFSGRGPSTMNHTLWASWAIVGPTKRIYFSGDTGPFPGFSDIGHRFGPFDLTLIKIGAYGEGWPDVHLNPDQALDAHIDLDGRLMQPIHWGTFNLALHDWYEPAAWLLTESRRREISIVIPKPGEMVEPSTLNGPIDEWWSPDVRDDRPDAPAP